MIRKATGKKHQAKKDSRKLKHLEVREGKKGGHIVTHHFHQPPYSMNGPNQEVAPEEHPFGADQGQDMLAHVASAMNVPTEGDNGQPPEDVSAPA